MSAFTGEWREEHRFGSARWANETDMRPLREASGLYLGLDERGRSLFHVSDSPGLMIAGSGAGKGVSGGLIHNFLTYPGSILGLDVKGELASVSLLAQTLMGKPAFCINPFSLLTLPHHPVDPTDILAADSPTLVSDAKMISEMLVPLSGSASAKYWEEKARLLIEAILIADTEG